MPSVLPIVLYNGHGPWNAPMEMKALIAPVGSMLAAYQPSQRYLLVDMQRWPADALPRRNLVSALVELETGREPGQWLGVLRTLFGWLVRPEDREIRRAFAEWVAIALRHEVSGANAKRVMELTEGETTMLVERVKEWADECRRQGREEGIEQGLLRGIEQGMERGIERGIERGLAEERALLCRMADRKFGIGTGERLSQLLDGVTDVQHLALVGEWIIECTSGAELLARTNGD